MLSVDCINFNSVGVQEPKLHDFCDFCDFCDFFTGNRATSRLIPDS